MLTANRKSDALGFTTLDREVSVAALPIAGNLPEWLHGSLLRNGPARFEVGAERYRHWFDGLAMVHRFTIAGGNVSYANRFLRSPAFLEAERTGHIARAEFATNPHRSFVDWLGAVSGKAGASHNANVNIVPFADHFLAVTETPAVVAFDGTTLATRGVIDYDDDVAGQMTTAHAHYDAERDAVFNIVTEIGRISRYHVVRGAAGTLKRKTIASIVVDKPGYIHAFSTTERYIVLVEYPLVVRPLDLLLQRKPFIENYRWEPERGTRIHVIDKDGGAVAGTFESDAFFAFHHINAYEERDTIVLDVAAYDNADVIGDFMLERLRASDTPQIARASFRRLRLIPGTTAARVEHVTPAATELPSVARRNAGKPYIYAYGVNAVTQAHWAAFDELVKVDAGRQRVVRWSAPNAFPGEPIFVARPGATDEDDGVILSVVLDATAATSYLLVLDARTFAEHARVTAPHHIPFGFHGIFR